MTFLLRFGEPPLQRGLRGMEDYEEARAHLEFAAAEAHFGEDEAAGPRLAQAEALVRAEVTK